MLFSVSHRARMLSPVCTQGRDHIHVHVMVLYTRHVNQGVSFESLFMIGYQELGYHTLIS